MINFDELEQLDKEIQAQTLLLKTNTDGLESDIAQFKEIGETLNLLISENADLEKRLATSEARYSELQQQVVALEEVINKRDGVMKILLKTVGDLNHSVTQIRSSLSGQVN